MIFADWQFSRKLEICSKFTQDGNASIYLFGRYLLCWGEQISRVTVLSSWGPVSSLGVVFRAFLHYLFDGQAPLIFWIAASDLETHEIARMWWFVLVVWRFGPFAFEGK